MAMIESQMSPAAGRCPVDHRSFSQQKTAQVSEPAGRPLERDSDGVWHVRGYAQAQAVLRSAHTKQAGFKAELLEKLPGQKENRPILYLEGKPHHEQRKQTARFFTPKAVSENYRRLMEAYADQMIARLRRDGQADLSELGMHLAVRVAGEVVGLTKSRIPGMARRLNSFFNDDLTEFGWSPLKLLRSLRNQSRMLAFFYLDVKPSIEQRRTQPREDVISHLLGKGYSDTEILTECVTYGAAGMVTTREFISIAAWHLLEQPELREYYLRSDEEARLEFLQELLRLEPVVGSLYRRATADLELAVGDTTETIPEGDLICLHTYAINADETVVGEHPLTVCPQREIKNDKAGPAMMGFGDGQHRCPGAYIALQETDIFLRRLLALPNLTIVQKPSVSWNGVTAGYELRKFILSVR
ncbi:MAG TPA: cytochrome P450 [Herpetosiphonaceae bacterium]|nr:cytochrome P450 [Herpetosiphonaceae bacterium]